MRCSRLITCVLLTSLTFVSIAFAAWTWITPSREGLVEIDGNGFYMVADATCRQRPILTASIWINCAFNGKNVEILARSQVDLDWTAPLDDFKDQDRRRKVLTALVANTPLEAVSDQVRGMWGLGAGTRLSGEAFLFPSSTSVVADVTRMVMFHAVQAGRETTGIVAVGDLEIITGAEAEALHALSIRRLPISVKAMLKSFQRELFKY